MKIQRRSTELAGMKADALIESFDFERNKRGLIQYQTLEIEKNQKQNFIAKSKEFTEMENYLLIKMSKIITEEHVEGIPSIYYRWRKVFLKLSL